ncbi:hypothetical protein SprV_0100030800 [Sparganum proliferum]
MHATQVVLIYRVWFLQEIEQQCIQKLWTRIAYRTEGHLLKGPSTTCPSWLIAHSTESDRQQSMNLIASGCGKLGLIINADKTVLIHQPPPNAPYSVRRININGTLLKTVENLADLSSALTCCIRISKATRQSQAGLRSTAEYAMESPRSPPQH